MRPEPARTRCNQTGVTSEHRAASPLRGVRRLPLPGGGARIQLAWLRPSMASWAAASLHLSLTIHGARQVQRGGRPRSAPAEAARDAPDPRCSIDQPCARRKRLAPGASKHLTTRGAIAAAGQAHAPPPSWSPRLTSSQVAREADERERPGIWEPGECLRQHPDTPDRNSGE